MITETIYNSYLTRLLEGDRAGCGEIVRQLLEQALPIRQIYDGLFQKSLYRVGELWETNRISVAREHLATAITEGLMHLIYPRLFGGPRCSKKAIISCAANEYHQVGGRMVADIFELNGWHGYFLGANTPLEDLLAFIGETNPDLVGLSLSIASHMPTLAATIGAIRRDYPRLDLLVGGQAFRHGGAGAIQPFSRVQYLPSLEALEKEIGSRTP